VEAAVIDHLPASPIREREWTTKEEYYDYRPRGAARELFSCKDPEILLAGPAGTGKSRAGLEKLFALAEKYPGMRGAIVRKTRESLSEAALVTWEEKVVPPDHPSIKGIQRRMRQVYVFPNRSEIAVGGMDKATKILSTERDIIYVQEATELDEDDWEILTTRLRNGVIPYQQLIGDCNPDRPSHWLYQRCLKGLTRLIESRHEDNPTLWDEKADAWTVQGSLYIERLDRLTGARKSRLRFGRWVASEGTVYEDWDPQEHVFPNKHVVLDTLPRSWTRYWAVDFGFENPFVSQCWAVDEDGRLYLEWEIYKTHTLVEDHAIQMLEAAGAKAVDGKIDWSNALRPSAIVCDHDAEGRATLEKHLQMPTYPAEKAIEDGIQAVAARLRKAEDGKPRIFLRKGCVVSEDSSLLESKKPTCTAVEFDGYAWHKGTDGKPLKEEPIDVDNHGLDATRYMVMFLDRQLRDLWAV
jgi:PBSX family phage terminase large subunit